MRDVKEREREELEMRAPALGYPSKSRENTYGEMWERYNFEAH